MKNTTDYITCIILYEAWNILESTTRTTQNINQYENSRIVIPLLMLHWWVA